MRLRKSGSRCYYTLVVAFLPPTTCRELNAVRGCVVVVERGGTIKRFSRHLPHSSFLHVISGHPHNNILNDLNPSDIRHRVRVPVPLSVHLCSALMSANMIGSAPADDGWWHVLSSVLLERKCVSFMYISTRHSDLNESLIHMLVGEQQPGRGDGDLYTTTTTTTRADGA